MTKLRVRTDVVIRTLPDGDAVVARAEGSEAVIVNPTAHAILELLADEATEHDVADAVLGRFPRESPDAIRRDIHAVIERLVRDGILEPCGNASSTV